MKRLRISAVIPTYNRAELLTASLASLVAQTLPRTDYEVLVIDDGSTDETREVCGQFSDRLQLRYFQIRHSGIAAAKNIGIFAASSPVLFFFDDDDVAHADLLRQHVVAHQRWQDENVAVLGYTMWAPWLEITELMRYVTDVGQCLFSYPSLATGRPLDFTHFWGGRTSCKRSFLARHGAFRQAFEFGCEDIELAFRLSRFGLAVYFEKAAVSFMNRGITLEEFCRRSERQGRAQFIFADLHRDDVIQAYCDTQDAALRWADAEPRLGAALASIRHITASLATSRDPALRQELWDLYRFVFTAHKLKGMTEMAHEHSIGADRAAFQPVVIEAVG